MVKSPESGLIVMMIPERRWTSPEGVSVVRWQGLGVRIDGHTSQGDVADDSAARHVAIRMILISGGCAAIADGWSIGFPLSLFDSV